MNADAPDEHVTEAVIAMGRVAVAGRFSTDALLFETDLSLPELRRVLAVLVEEGEVEKLSGRDGVWSPSWRAL